MPDISDNTNWFEVDASNDRPPPAGWPEGQMPSTVNDCARAMMGAIKRFWDRINPTAPSITVTGNLWQYNTTDPAHPTAYVEGEIYSLLVAGPAVGGDQLQINSLTALPIYKITSTGPVATVANDWLAGAMPRFAYRSDLNAGAGGWLYLDTPPLPITADASGNITFPGNVIFSANAAVTGSLAVTGGAVFTSTLAVSGHVGLGGGLGVTGGATVDTLTVSGATSLGAVNIGANLNVAGDEWARSYNLNSGAAYIDSSGDISGNGNLNIGGSGTFAAGNVIAGGNGIAYFGSGHQVGFTWDGTVEAYVDRTSVGALALQNGSPSFGNLTVTGNLTCSNQVSTNTLVANGITSNGAISAASSVSASTIIGNSSASFASNNVAIHSNGVSYFGDTNQIGFTWSGPALNLYINRSNVGNALYSNHGTYLINADNDPGNNQTGYTLACYRTDGSVLQADLTLQSDVRLKQDIRDTKIDALAAVCAVPVRSFKWRKAAQKLLGSEAARAPRDIGLVAQEVQQHMPNAVSATERQRDDGLPDDIHRIHDQAITPYLIRAIQQLTERVAELEGARG